MLEKEVNYEFRKRMLEVHKKDIRDFSLIPEENEYEIKDFTVICIAEHAEEVAVVAVQDFSDFLLKSMDVSVMVKKGDIKAKEKIELFIADEKGIDLGKYKGYRGYRIDTDDNGIKIYANDYRGMAQALYYLEFMMELRHAPFIKKGTQSRKPRFAPQMVHSGYACDDFPDAHLSAIAHEGRDAILVFVKGINETTFGYLDFNALIYRAKRYGIDVYAYSYLRSKVHPEEEAAPAFYESTYGELFKNCPGFKGVILVGESVWFPDKDGTAGAVDGIPTIDDSAFYSPKIEYATLVKIIRDSCRKYNPDADIVFWTYNFNSASKEDRLALIDALPKDISLLLTFSNHYRYKMKDSVICLSDYSLVSDAPSEVYTEEAEEAKKKGIRLYSMVNTAGMTWDFGTIPYEPFPQQWMRLYENMFKSYEKHGLCGIMESHHYGIYPSFISKLSRLCFDISTDTMEDSFNMVLSAFFGSENVEIMKEALDKWSESVRYITPTGEDQYGAFRVGPSYPLNFERSIQLPSSPLAHFGNSILVPDYCADIQGRSTMISKRIWDEIESLEKSKAYVDEGLAILEIIENPNEELERLINMGHFLSNYILTGLNAKKWHTLIVKFDSERDEEKVSKILDEMVELLTLERQNAVDSIKYVELDSRLGWEPSMEYMTDKWHIDWKIRHTDFVIKKEIATYRTNLELGKREYEDHRD